MCWVSASERFYGNKLERVVRRAELWAPSLPASYVCRCVLSFLCFWAGGNSHTHFISDTVGHELWSLSIFLPTSTWHPLVHHDSWLTTDRQSDHHWHSVEGSGSLILPGPLSMDAQLTDWLTHCLDYDMTDDFSDPSGVVHWMGDDMPDGPAPHGLFHTDT